MKKFIYLSIFILVFTACKKEIKEKKNTDLEQTKEEVTVVTPNFVDYENYKGGTTSLHDLKGKYVYIDIWATWCNPCKYEIPFMKKIEEKYHGKNIEFVSISIDGLKDHAIWKQMVKDREMTGIQLYAKGDQNFINALQVSSIPRFILIDPQGAILEEQAPNPSNPKLIELLDSLEI